MYNCYTPRVATKTQVSTLQTNSEIQAQRKKDDTGPSPARSESFRMDGRAYNQLRPVFIDLNTASGSAYLEMEHTKVLVAVYGPKARQDVEFSDEGKLICDFRYSPFALRARRPTGKEKGGREGGREGGGGGGGGPQRDEERAASRTVSQALEASVQLAKLPKSVVEVFVLVLQTDGGEVGAAISCASLALAEAGIELFGLVASCEVVAFTPSEGKREWRVRVDPTAAEEGGEEGGREGGKEGGVVGLALMPVSGEVTQVWQKGRLDTRGSERALEMAADGARMVHALMRKRLLTYMEQEGGGEGGWGGLGEMTRDDRAMRAQDEKHPESVDGDVK
ncbi:Exoribonuclease, phosphorolytic domain 1 [Nannochloropsis gaditana]|uniref:Exoribonuclease, phosphorolytic domain 1 n=1 Tax=Nannochloropsis gaditana TaxID=72520 RepID=W7TGY6_9STRA|nr:Exoribonuclease, phosphorolytic domain 1 [Nannochloropsis gaditana]